MKDTQGPAIDAMNPDERATFVRTLAAAALEQALHDGDDGRAQEDEPGKVQSAGVAPRVSNGCRSK